MSAEISESKFNMWRSIVALIYADGEISVEEEEFVRTKIRRLNFNKEQEDLLKEDITNPKDVNELYQKITDPKDRGQFIYFARLLFWSDGDFDKQEQEIFNHFREGVLSKTDVAEAKKDAHDMIRKFEAEYNREVGIRGRIGLALGSLFGF